MATLVTDPDLAEQLIKDRKFRGIDQRDEVWEGVYVMTPAPNDEHQDLVGGFTHVLRETIDHCQLGKSRPGVNLSDRVEDWTRNFRCPDVVVFLNDTTAEFHNTFWLGGPDLAIEVVSPEDQSREKLSFYEKIGTRELLIVDRDPWQLELHRLAGKKLVLAGTSTLADPVWLVSETVPLKLRLQPDEKRPVIELVTSNNEKKWRI
ncbi:MAG: Uma2 family endonuclease [Planctomycetes bacterium]|nr:Uma2 family endonuclease [Planctomycetota bacterium]